MNTIDILEDEKNELSIIHTMIENLLTEHNPDPSTTQAIVDILNLIANRDSDLYFRISKEKNELKSLDSVNIDHVNELIKVIDNTDDISDGFHTFGSLYDQRAKLFSVIVNSHPDISWKTKRHEDGTLCFGGGWFLVTISTPDGDYGYHYEEKYWDLFNCKVLDHAKHWDGYTDKDVDRLFSLNKEEN